jgi:hypothetical protein
MTPELVVVHCGLPGLSCDLRAHWPPSQAAAATDRCGWPGCSCTRAYAVVMPTQPRRACVEDVHELALAMPYVTVDHGPRGNPVYQVGGKSFVFFRPPRPDASDPQTGERYTDVIVFWVTSESDKQALVQDETSPFLPHRILTAIHQCYCGPAGSASSPGKNWLKWSRTPGFLGRRATEGRPGSRNTTFKMPEDRSIGASASRLA